MTHYLRDQKNNTILDCEVYTDNYYDGTDFTEISVAVEVKNYSLHLLNITKKTEQIDFLMAIDNLSELREWLWESFYMTGKNDGTKKQEIEEKVGDMFKEVAEYFDLLYITD